MKTPIEQAILIVLNDIINNHCLKASRQIAAIRKAARTQDHAEIHELSAATTRVLRELEKLDDMRIKMRELAIFGHLDVLANLEKKGAA